MRVSDEIWRRLRHMLFGWGTVGIAYGLAGLLQGEGVTLTEAALDRLIAFNPAGIWLYLSFFVLVPYAYLATDAGRLRWLQQAMQLSALLCGLFFFIWPTTLAYPALPQEGISAAALRFLATFDTRQNCLPSLHGALTALSVWALLDRRSPMRSALSLLWGISICFSIIQLRRHLSIDLAAGLAAGVACGWLCMRHHARRQIACEQFP